MTTTPSPSIAVYAPTGSAVGPFATGWTYSDPADVWVYVETYGVAGPDLVEGADYSVTGATPTVDGGSVTLDTLAVPDGGWTAAHRLVVRRWTARRQAVALPDTEGHRPRATEGALDRAMRIAEEQTDDIDRTMKAPVGEPGFDIPPAELRGGRFFGGDPATGALGFYTPEAISKPNLNIYVPSINDAFTGVGQGNADIDQAAFDVFAGGPVKLKPYTQYLKTRRTVLGDGGKVVDETNTASILMLTGAGQFDLAGQVFAQKFGNRHTAFHAQSKTGVEISGIDFYMQANAAIRVCQPITFQGCRKVLVDGVDIYNFDMPWYGLITIQSCPEFIVQNARAFDITSAKTGLTDGLGNARTPQNTLLEIDNDRYLVDTDYSFNGRVRNLFFDNGEFTGAAKAAYGQQSDVLNIQSPGSVGIRFDNIRGRRIGEVVDCFGRDCIGSAIFGEDVYLDVLKLIHGASRNVVTGIRAQRTGLHGVHMNNSNSVAVPCEDNQISDVLITDVGFHHEVWAAALTLPSGVMFDAGNSPTTLLRNNSVRGVLRGTAGKMQAVVSQIAQAGFGAVCSGNAFQGDGSGQTLGFSRNVGGGGRVTIASVAKAKINAWRSTNVSVANGARIPFNALATQADARFDTATGIFTADREMTVAVVAQYRIPALLTGEEASVRIIHDDQTATPTRGQGNVNGPVSNNVIPSGAATIDLKAGDRLWVTANNNIGGSGATQTVTGDIALTKFEISEL